MQLSKQAVAAIVNQQADPKAAFATESRAGVPTQALLQVVHLDILEGEKALKVKARLQLSDGESKLHCMVPEKIWKLIVRREAHVRKASSFRGK